MGKVAVILGTGGALGQAVARRFIRSNWELIEYKRKADAHSHSDITQLNDILSDTVLEIQLSGGKVQAVINVAGGFRADSATSDSFLENYRLMESSSLETSIISARIAARYLEPGGLLVLPGAAAALGPTPWAVTYGACKAGVHHMVRSLGTKDGGMPKGSFTVGIAPVMLDTPANRTAMPEADTAKWTPLDVVAERIQAWAEGKISPENGSIYKIVTKNGSTEFLAL